MTEASDNDKKRKKTDRLAVALRENLRRRKAQVRQRAAPAESGQKAASRGDKPS